MEQLKRELEANFSEFSANWKSTMLEVTGELESSRDKYLKSYTRLVSLQAWRLFLEARISEDSLAFFLEAQNDALISHVLARLGSWRSALKSLRSSIENVLFCLYYMDHSIELTLWHQGKHRLGFTELVKYFEHHPQVLVIPKQLNGLTIFEQEYATLSKAVHGSAKSFRMTVDAKSTLLWSGANSSLGSWVTRERSTLLGINLLLLSLFRDQLHGTSLPDLRNVISLAVPPSMYAPIQDQMGITLIRL